jgi:hypothetical protein
MADMYLPYGVNDDGQLIYIDQVGRGRTSLHCPYCGMGLIARKGAQVSPHFAHDGATCREAGRSAERIALPAYDSFQLRLSPREWESLRAFHDEGSLRNIVKLEAWGMVKRGWARLGRLGDYELTHAGKIPFGELSLDLFNKYQEPLFAERFDELARTLTHAKGTVDEHTALIDLALYRAQLLRVLGATLYFLEVQTPARVLHKIGVTSRPVDQRIAEIRADLAPHYGAVDIKPIGTWERRGNVELYFKFRYRQFNHPIGALTEYFAFDDVKPVLRDLRRMKPSDYPDVMARLEAQGIS